MRLAVEARRLLIRGLLELLRLGLVVGIATQREDRVVLLQRLCSLPGRIVDFSDPQIRTGLGIWRSGGTVNHAIEVLDGQRHLWRMSEFQPLIDQLYREQIQDARAQSMEVRFLGTFEITDFAYSFSRGAVESQFADASPEERQRQWERRLRIQRYLSEEGIYFPKQRAARE